MSPTISSRSLLLVLASGAFLLGGCGRNASSSRSEEPPAPAQSAVANSTSETSPVPAATSGLEASPHASHPCTLLTNADAAAILGNLQRPEPVESSLGGAYTCVWESAAGHITLLTAGTQEGVEFLQSQYGLSNQDVPGVGDNASWSKGGASLLVQKGGTHFVLVGAIWSADLSRNRFTLDDAKGLAAKVIAGL